MIDATALQVRIVEQLASQSTSMQSDAAMMGYATHVHSNVQLLLSQQDFVDHHGLYYCNHDLMLEWVAAWRKNMVEALATDNRLEDFARLGWQIYAGQLRHAAARRKLWACFDVCGVHLAE